MMKGPQMIWPGHVKVYENKELKKAVSWLKE